jgi:hypothetical protein
MSAPALAPFGSPTRRPKADTTWNGERAWSVIVFRREMEGWKKMVFEPPGSSSSSSSSRRFIKYKPQKVYSPAIPRQGCIVLPGLKQKWSLRNETEIGTVIRRGNKILLRSKGRARVLMLQFTSLEECLSFADWFVTLNPMHHHTTNNIPTTAGRLATATAAVAAVAVSPQKKEQQQASQDSNFGGGEDSDMSSQPHVSTPASPASNITTAVAMPPPPPPPDLETEQRAVNGMIVRLLHDREFLRFVHKIENYVLNAEDGSKMLQGLQDRDLSQG